MFFERVRRGLRIDPQHHFLFSALVLRLSEGLGFLGFLLEGSRRVVPEAPQSSESLSSKNPLSPTHIEAEALIPAP